MKKRLRKKMELRKDETQEKMNYRAMSLPVREDGTPATVDEKGRTVEVVGATDEPTEVFDWERLEVVKEVLLMEGAELPGNRQVPLLDSHSRYSTASVMGSFRGMRAEKGQLVGRVHFSTVAEAEPVWTKVREGHLTDFSVGYRVIEAQWIPDGERMSIKGRDFVGPLKVATRWRPKELSAVPIGADEFAKARGEVQPESLPKKSKDKETLKMNEKLRKMLIAMGMRADATDEEAWAFFDRSNAVLQEPKPEVKPEVKPAVAPVVDEDKVRSEAMAVERERIANIDVMARQFNIPEAVRESLIKEGKSIDESRKIVLDHVAAQLPEGIGYRGPVIEKDEHDKFREAATDSLLLRGSGQYVKAPEKPAAGADELRGLTLRELARESLRVAGIRIPSNVLEMVGRALTTGDLPYVLGATANKSLMAGYSLAPETWRTWCGVGSASDFKTHTLHRVSESDSLEEVPELGDYQYGERSEKKESYQLATYGKIFGISRQAIINDDLGALTDTPAKHGRAAARKVGDVAYAVLTGNAVMGDGIALFDASTHANYITSGAAPGVATIGVGIKQMGLQKDLNGSSYLNIRPEYFIGTKALEGAAEVFFNSFQFSDHSTVATDSSFASTRMNPYAGSYFTRVYDARLDAAVAAGWYLAGPKGMTVNVYFLGGQETPFMEQRQGWTVDGVEYKVRIDVAAKAVDWVALFYNDGA